MKVLVACEESQVVCKAFRARGHEAYSCDIQECSGGHPEWHIKGDVLKVINPSKQTLLMTGTPTGIPKQHCMVKEWIGITFQTMDGVWHTIEGRWDILICHPPCTFMSKAGARFMYPSAGVIDEERLAKALEAKEFFLKLWNADCHRICIENPTPLKVVGLPPPSQIVEPYYFGDPYSKRTLLWEKNLPPLKPTNILREYVPYMPSNTGGLARGMGGSRGVAHDAKTASKTFKGVAEAMADQWGDPSTYEFNQQLSIFD